MSDRFNMVKKGYDPEAVDRYIATLEAQIETYREKDKAINNAIISAQQAADNIILNARNQSRVIRENTVKQMGDISLSVNAQRQMLSEFEREYIAVVSKYLRPTDNEDFVAIGSKIDALESYLADFSDEVSEDLELEKRGPNAD